MKHVQIQNNVKVGQREAKVQNDMMGEKRADLLLVKEHSQQQARTGEDWLRQEGREPTDGESDTHVQ